MRKKTIDIDRSRNGYLVHKVFSQGRVLTIIAYIEGIEEPRYEIESTVICRTQEQASLIVDLLSKAKI